MQSLGFEVVLFIVAVIAAALIWSLINRWDEDRSQDPDTRSGRRRKF